MPVSGPIELAKGRPTGEISRELSPAVSRSRVKGYSVLQRLFDRLIRRLSVSSEEQPGAAAPRPEQHRVSGFPVEVLNQRPDIQTSDALARLTQALELIERHAPDRLAWLREDVSTIVVQRFPCRAAFYPAQRACLVELTFLVNPRHTAAEVASSIVHEGVHARIAAGRGVPGRPPSQAAEERLCREAEADFGARLGDEPGAEVVRERARQSLLLADAEVAPDIDWNLASRRVADADRGAGPG